LRAIFDKNPDMPTLDTEAVKNAIRWFFYEEGKCVSVSYRKDRSMVDVVFADGSSRYSVFQNSWKAAETPSKASTVRSKTDHNAMDEFKTLRKCSPGH
jgi:hypothetical protein